MATYSLARVKGTIHNVRSRFECELLEDGIGIAKVVRPGSVTGFFEGMKFKFYITNAKYRFQDFCNALSMEETVEALNGRL